MPEGKFIRLRSRRAHATLFITAVGLLLIAVRVPRAAAPESFRFAILGDRTGEVQSGVYEQVCLGSATRHSLLYLVAFVI